jgi:hypothetical protein
VDGLGWPFIYALWYSVRLLGSIATVLTGLRTLASWLLAFEPCLARSCSDGGMNFGCEWVLNEPGVICVILLGKPEWVGGDILSHSVLLIVAAIGG